MTREELIQNIQAIESTKVVDLVRHGSLSRWKQKKFLQLIDQWTAEVIGDEESMVGEYRDELHDIITRNLERDEARIRAGLSTKGVSFFDMSDKDKTDILETAAKESNKAQRELVERVDK